MSLFARLREKQKWNTATATLATFATEEGVTARSVATVATVAVASPEKLKTEAGNKAGVSCWWQVCYCDRPPLEILYPSGAVRAEVLAAYPDALEAHPFAPAILQPSSPLSAEEETMLRRWLAYTGETDPAIIAATIDQCQRDANARKRALEMAAEELEAFEERAAIMEFDGGLTRAEAQRLAGRYPTAPAC